jgi:mannose-6-phosphate isomerase-like protein (cupin superfamily)
VPPGGETAEHLHHETEEIYHFTRGAGRMRLGDEERAVRAGDCVVIAPGVAHNSGTRVRRRWSCSVPALRPTRDADTELTGR